MSDTKKCPRCGEEKPRTEFYRHPTNGRTYPYCRPCNRAYQKERAKQRKANGERASNSEAPE